MTLTDFDETWFLHSLSWGEGGGEAGGLSLPDSRFGLMIYGFVGIFIYTKSNVLMHFIDAYITELAFRHPRVGLQSAR